MRILVLSSDPGFELPHSGKAPLSFFLAAAADAEDYSDDEADIVYLDRSGLSPGDFRRLLILVKRFRACAAWGVADRSGEIDDPAALFHDGASDYLGPRAFAAGVDAKRVKRAMDYRADPGAQDAAASPRAAPEAREARRRASAEAAAEAPAFPGWQALKPGEERDFHFLYASPSNPGFIKAKIGETRFQAFKERFRAVTAHLLSEAGALPWIGNDNAVLFLVPPDRDSAGKAVLACLKALLAAPILGYERFGLEIPLSLTFALHKGRSPYQPPGKTGTIVSDDVNFIHHLGLKRAEPDRVTVTVDAARAIPEEFADMFAPAGEFEDRGLLHSLRFAGGGV